MCEGLGYDLLTESSRISNVEGDKNLEIITIES